MSDRSMADMVASWPSQLRWSTAVGIPDLKASRLLVCGMGGSGIAGAYVASLATTYGHEIAVHHDYGVPAWAYRARPTVVIMSYSGNTEEALASFHAAAEGGLPLIAVTTGGELARLAGIADVPVVTLEGGYQPRAAFAMGFGVLLRLAAAAGLLPDPKGELTRAAAHAERTLRDGRPIVAEAAEHAASAPVHVLAAEPYGAVGYRWKTQFNENADRFASTAVVPEMNHNELVPLAAGTGPAVFALRTGAEPAAITRRFELMAEMMSGRQFDVWAQGDGEIERMVDLTLIGDLVTVAVAQANGVDPVAVDALEIFKHKLRER